MLIPINRIPAAGWLGGLILLLGIAGCAVDQSREVGIYREVLDGGKNVSVESFDPDESLTLVRALQLANAQNEQLAIAGENYLQTLIDKDRAFAAFLPTIGLAAVFMRQEKTNLGSGNSLISEFVPEHTDDVSANGNMNLHPFRDAPAVKAAGSSVRMQKALLLDQQAILLLDVARTYFQVMSAEERVKVLQHSLEVEDRRLADIRIKQKAGVARLLDVSLVEAHLAETRNRLIQVENDVDHSRAMLAFLMGVSEVRGPLVNDLRIPKTIRRMDALLETAGSHRQDLLAARERVKVAAAALEAAWGEYFPSVSLDLTVYLSRESFPSDVDWTSLIRVNLPVFSAGLIHADVRTAYSRLRQARLAEMRVERQVSKDLQLVRDDLDKDDRQIKQLELTVRTGKDSVKQAEAALQAGAGTELERLTAQQRLLSAELALSDAGYNRCVDYLILLRLTGALRPELSAPPPDETIPMDQREDEKS